MTSSGAVPKDTVRLTAMKVILASLALVLGGCMGYVPGQQSYWDGKVKEMCEKEGGIKVYEKVSLSPQDFGRLSNRRGKLDLPSKDMAIAGQEYVYTTQSERIVEGSLSVIRHVTSVIRTSDNKILSEKIEFARVGGDIPTGINQPSAFLCPKFEAGENIFDVTFEVVR